MRIAVPLEFDKEIVERLAHEIFDLPVKIEGELLDRFVGVLVEVAHKRLLPDPARLDVASGAIAAASACRSRSLECDHVSDN